MKVKEAWTHARDLFRAQCRTSALTRTDLFASLTAAFFLTAFLSLLIFGQEPPFWEISFNRHSLLLPFAAAVFPLSWIAMLTFAFHKHSHDRIKILLLVNTLLLTISLARPQNALRTPSEALPFLLGLSFLFYLILCYVFPEEAPKEEWDLSLRHMVLLSCLFASVMAILLGSAGILRYHAGPQESNCLDHYIYTLERLRPGPPVLPMPEGEPPAFSAFLYLLAPLYFLIPQPETLLILQALALVCGFFPLILFCRQLDFSNRLTLSMVSIYLAFPTLVLPAMQDFHLCVFLPVLLLWYMVLLMEERKKALLLLSALILLVQADAFVYILAIGAYVVFIRGRRRRGLILMGIASAACLGASVLFELFGEENLFSPLSNYDPNGAGSLWAWFCTVMSNPGYLLAQLFRTEKLSYLLCILLPLGFVPLIVRQKTRLMLLLPLLVLNLMPASGEVSRLVSPAGYGSTTLAIVLYCISMKEIPILKRKRCIGFSLLFLLLHMGSVFLPWVAFYYFPSLLV